MRLQTIGDYEVAIKVNEEDIESEKDLLEEGNTEWDEANMKIHFAEKEIKRLEELVARQKIELAELTQRSESNV